MDHGRILALDTPAGLKATVGADTIVTIRVSGDATGLAEALERGVEGTTRVRDVDGGAEVHVKGTTGVLRQAIAAADRGGYHLADLSVTEPTLETVFINLTGKDLRD
jgi:ABC-2 type transport system ATP-binding protein